MRAGSATYTIHLVNMGRALPLIPAYGMVDLRGGPVPISIEEEGSLFEQSEEVAREWRL